MRSHSFVTILTWAGLLLHAALAQQTPSPGQMSFSDLIAQAQYAIDNQDSETAIPVLKEIISRAGSLEDREAKESVQMARLQLGASYSRLQQWGTVRRYTEEYLAGDPVKDRQEALLLLCQAYFGEESWDRLYETAQLLLDQSGLRLKTKESVDKYMLQAQFRLGNYAKTLSRLSDAIKNTRDPANLRAYQIMKLRCLYETGDTDSLITALPEMFRGDSRYDVTLNLTLLRIGDQLFAGKEYRKALAIYRLVVPKTTLMARQQKRLDELDGGEDRKKNAGEDSEARQQELQQELETLHSVPDYDIHIAYRAAQIYSEQQRYWESVALFEQIYLNHPSTQEGHSAYLQKLLVLFQIGADEEAVSESMAYLENHRDGLFPRLVCAQLAQYYLEKQELKKALALRPGYVDEWAPPADEDERAQDSDLHYMFSFILFQLGEYEQALTSFDRVIQINPDSQAAVDSNYWKAMCRLLQQKYDLAYDQFMKYRKSWPNASFAPAALFRAGVCRFGLEDYKGAQELFKTFIDEHPEDALMPEALSMYGDLLAAAGLIDEALASYDRALTIVGENYSAATDPLLRKEMVVPATYAAVQATKALMADAEAYASQQEQQTAETKYRQIIQWMERYNQTFGTDADWAQGIFWIGKAQMELGEVEQAVNAYLNAVILYGADPSQEGVSDILFDLAGIIQNRLSKPQREATLLEIQDARSRAQSPTVQIQLDVLLADLNGTQAELGRTLLASKNSLDAVPPSGIALMCSALLEKKDFSRSRELFDYFAAHYEQSPFRVASYQLLATDLYQQNKTDEALALATEALASYGAIAETGWAQIMKGNIELARGGYAQAADTFNMVFGVRVWRGPIFAEAMFRMAEAWEKQGNLEKAFAFFQRTYLLYKAYDNGKWAAEGYLRSAECLKKMGRMSAARNTYRAMLLDEYVRELPQAQVAKQVLGPQETAELLAGGTNTLERIELKEGL
jgi:tetratricopeptide (TPR) repeat protein